jgi:OOP family OmpA-OmpF porin
MDFVDLLKCFAILISLRTIITMINIKKSIFSLALLGLSSFAFADGYLMSNDNTYVKTNYNNCIRTGSWTPQNAVKECDPLITPDKVNNNIISKIEAPIVDEVVDKIKPKDLINNNYKIIEAQTLFGFNKYKLTDDGKKIIKDLSLQINKGFKNIALTGFTDFIGSESYNKKLSEKRATTVKAEFIKNGVSNNAFELKGMTTTRDENVINNCHTNIKECVSHDRRVDIVIVLE